MTPTRAQGVHDYPRLDARTILAGTPMAALLDSVTEEDKKQAGMERAAAGEGPEWRDYAYSCLEALAKRQRTLFVDDLYAACDWLPRNPNAWGSVWARAKREGLIEKTGQMRPSRLPGKHAHEYVVYRSLVWECGA